MLFIGCYMLMAGVLIVIFRQTRFLTKSSFTTLCVLERLLTGNSFVLIPSTILLRIARIYKIFTHFGKISNYWKNKFLILYTILLCIPYNVIQFIQIAVDHLAYTEQEIAFDPPYIIIFPYCYSESERIFESLTFIYYIIIMIAIVVFAIQTRNIPRKHFKDTKKLLLMAYCQAIVLPLVVFHYRVLQELQFYRGAMILAISTQLFCAALVLLFLLMPKILSVLCRKVSLSYRFNILLQRCKIT